MPITTILFDVDNTLYDAECGVETEMSRRIDHFVSEFLDVTEEESRRLRAENLPVYGTSLRWLQVCHNFTDTQRYMDEVHPENLGDYIAKNHQLRDMLESLPQELAVFTNGPEFHARRVLKALGIEEVFPHFFALEHMGFRGKPYQSAYELVLDSMGIQAENTLFLDDKEVNLDTFHQMGGHGVLVGQASRSDRYPVIPTILGLKDYLNRGVKG
jgi:putative hydrolase of the HAD superfamily